jgi:hypothetical protein
MKTCNIFALLICVFTLNASHAQDDFKNLFSIGFGAIACKYQLSNMPNATPKLHAGAYIDLVFRWKKLGFNTGFQYIDRNFSDQYPYNPNITITGHKHRSHILACPLVLNYEILDAGNLKLFVLPGFAYTRMRDDIYPKYDRNLYAYPPRSTYTRSHILSWSGGLGAEKNLYKKDVWLSLQIHYMKEFDHKRQFGIANSSNRLFCKLGLNIMMSRIDARSKAKALKAS